MVFPALVALAGAVAGAVAAVGGFGIGSLLTPLLALRAGTATAVAAVSIPHLLGTLLRFRMLRRHLDRRLLWSFGLASAAGGLLGALLHGRAASPVLARVFGGLLVLSGATGLAAGAWRLRISGAAAWAAGVLSGLFGGLVGNQGGIRSAALLGLEVPRDAFVATATAVALLVDAARVPVYLLGGWRDLLPMWPLIAAAAAGVLVGTALGARLLRRIPEPLFRTVVAALVLGLGVWMLVRG